MTDPRPLHEIAADIFADWPREKMAPAALPWATAMKYLTGTRGFYGAVPAKDVIRKFLAASRPWIGPVARSVKAELRSLLDA